MEEDVLHAIPIFNGSRWQGAVEVVRLPRSTGSVVVLRIRIGHRFLQLPRHDLEQLCAAVLEGGKEASRLYGRTIQRKP
jgi:hypothetical protein